MRTVSDEVHEGRGGDESLADTVRGRTERTVEEEVETALRRIDGIDEDEREVIEETAERVARRLMRPVVESLEEADETEDADVFEEILFDD
ncbi:MAG: hypothetical protein U5J64_06275 [Halobacteriales archaeon]|nr:hypothetical protein [Halobacteriales archaeon]